LLEFGNRWFVRCCVYQVIAPLVDEEMAKQSPSDLQQFSKGGMRHLLV
jgi:hypothetical protein